MEGNEFHNFGYMTSQATIPNKRDKPGWLSEHMKHIELSKNPRVGRVLLIGDDNFGALPNFPQIWSKYLAPLMTLNYGLYGDQTQHVLWRVQNGLVPLNVEVIVIYAGGNNLGVHTSKDIANGIACIASELRSKKSDVKIVICGLLPIYNLMYKNFGKKAMKRAKNVNKYLKSFCKKGNISDCYYLKPDDDWVMEDGTLNLTYGTGTGVITQVGNEKLCKSIIGVIELLKVGVKVEISSDSEIEEDDDPPPVKVKLTSSTLSALKDVKHKKSKIVLQDMKRSRKISSSMGDSARLEKPVSTSSKDHRRRSRHRDRSRSRSPHRSQSGKKSSPRSTRLPRRSSARKRSEKSRSKSTGGGTISPVFTVKHGRGGKVSRSPSPTKPSKKCRSPDIGLTSIITPSARVQSRSVSPSRSPVKEGIDNWLQRASERLSPEANDFVVSSCWDPSPSGTGCNTPAEPVDVDPSADVDAPNSANKMYGLVLHELEGMTEKDEIEVSKPTAVSEVVGS